MFYVDNVSVDTIYEENKYYMDQLTKEWEKEQDYKQNRLVAVDPKTYGMTFEDRKLLCKSLVQELSEARSKIREFERTQRISEE